MAKPRISYVPLEQMDAAMRAEMERCAREVSDQISRHNEMTLSAIRGPIHSSKQQPYCITSAPPRRDYCPDLCQGSSPAFSRQPQLGMQPHLHEIRLRQTIGELHD